jgi:hypothetical protein
MSELVCGLRKWHRWPFVVFPRFPAMTLCYSTVPPAGLPTCCLCNQTRRAQALKWKNRQYKN